MENSTTTEDNNIGNGSGTGNSGNSVLVNGNGNFEHGNQDRDGTTTTTTPGRLSLLSSPVAHQKSQTQKLGVNNNNNNMSNTTGGAGGLNGAGKDPPVDEKSVLQFPSEKVNNRHTERLRLLQTRQNEERLRKLEELKEHAATAARLRSEQDARRRRHFEDLSRRDDDRRVKAEEKRRHLEEERMTQLQNKFESKSRTPPRTLDIKKPVYAFGSCTPRIVENNVDGCLWKSTYNLNHTPTAGGMKTTTSAYDLMSREASRAFSQQRSTFELAAAPVRGKSVERTNLWGGDFKSDTPDSSRTSFFCGRRRTDLTPTIPVKRDASAGSRSGNSTPRPPSSMTSSMVMSSSMHSNFSTATNTSSNVRPRTLGPRRARPTSVHVTGVSVATTPGSEKTTPRVRPTTASRTSSTTPKAESAQKSSLNQSQEGSRPATAVKKSEAGVKKDAPKVEKKTPTTKSAKTKESPSTAPGDTGTIKRVVKSATPTAAAKPAPVVVATQVTNENPLEGVAQEQPPALNLIEIEPEVFPPPMESSEPKTMTLIEHEIPAESLKTNGTAEESPSGTQTPSSDDKKILRTEEEAKAALVEKRRIAREQQEREALRLQEEARLEEEARLRAEREEEERYRKEMEEEARVLEEARRGEEERLKRAIEEKERREEEEKRKRAEEEQARLERDREDREAAREAERVRLEMEERLRREEEERLERKRRVEAIMSRTRKKELLDQEQQQEQQEKSASLQESIPEKSILNGSGSGGATTPSSIETPTPQNLNNFNNNQLETLIDFGESQSTQTQQQSNSNITSTNNSNSNLQQQQQQNPLQDLLS